MIFKTILTLLLTLNIVDINARHVYLDTNWGDFDNSENSDNWYGGNNNWEASNMLGQSNLLDYNKNRDDAKAQEANWVRGAIRVVDKFLAGEAVREIFHLIPRGMLIAPADEFTTEPLFPVNRTTTKRPFKRRKNKS